MHLSRIEPDAMPIAIAADCEQFTRELFTQTERYFVQCMHLYDHRPRESLICELFTGQETADYRNNFQNGVSLSEAIKTNLPLHRMKKRKNTQ